MRMDIIAEVILSSSHTVMWYTAFFGIGFTQLVHAILSVVTFGWIESPSVKYLNELESFSTVVTKGWLFSATDGKSPAIVSLQSKGFRVSTWSHFRLYSLATSKRNSHGAKDVDRFGTRSTHESSFGRVQRVDHQIYEITFVK